MLGIVGWVLAGAGLGAVVYLGTFRASSFSGKEAVLSFVKVVIAFAVACGLKALAWYFGDEDERGELWTLSYAYAGGGAVLGVVLGELFRRVSEASSLFALRIPLPRGARFWVAILAPATLIGAWCGLSYGGVVEASFLPSPTEVARGLLVLFFEHELGEAVWTSTRRIGIAFGLAAATALPLGVLMGSFEPFNKFFDPIMAPLRFMPIVAFIPLMIVWFGIDESQKIAFLFLGVFVYLVPVVVAAIRSVPQHYVDTAYTLGASRWQVIRTVLIPAALPEIFESFRVMNAIAWTYVVLAEGVNPGTSLGYIIHLAYTHARPDWSFAGLVVIGAVGLLSDAVIRGANAVLFRWQDKSHG